MLARLRLLLAMSLLFLGTWFAALALEGYLPPAAPLRAQSDGPSPGLSASPDAQQFISFLTRERFVVEAAPPTKPQAKSQLNSHAKPQTKSELEAKSPQGASTAKPSAAEKRRSASAAQLPWPLNLFGE
jgi:hypothetical protein